MYLNVTKLLIRPTMNHTPEVKVHGKEMLAELGPLSTQEKKVAVGFILALLGWGTAILTGFNANAIGIAVVAYLMVTKALEWKDALAEKAAWDTVVWFGVFISLATGLSKLGFIKWFTGVVSAQLAGSAWIAAFLLLLVIYVYTHYLFATVAAHVIAMYVPFAAVAIVCGAPVGLVAIAFCIFSNPMWGLTEYGSGPGPLYFGQGYFERPRFYALNFAVITMDAKIQVVSCESQIGGGSLPLERMESRAVSIQPNGMSVAEMEEKMRHLEIPIIPRTVNDSICLDVRTIERKDYKMIASELTELLGQKEKEER